MNEPAETYDVLAIRTRLLSKMGACAGDYPHHVERHFPRILAQFADLWGTARLDWYLESLMLPERQERDGFPLDVAIDILRLSRISATRSSAPTQGSGWSSVEERARARTTVAGE